MAPGLEDPAALLEAACCAPINRALVDQEIFDVLADNDRRLRSLSPAEWGVLRESVMKMASLVYMTYSLANPDDFKRILTCCTPAAVAGVAERFQSLPWLLEHRILQQARGRLHPGNLLRFNLNQSVLTDWHNHPPIAPPGERIIPVDPPETH